MELKEWNAQIPWQDFSDRTIIGVDGLSRSGKTAFSKELEAHLKSQGIAVHLFHIDDFIVERKRRFGTGLESWQEYYFLQWEAELLAEFFFGKLKSAGHLDLWFYDGETDNRRLQTVVLPEKGVIVVEGVFLQRKEWRHFFDWLVYLEGPGDERNLTETENMQETAAVLKQRYWKAEAYYQEMVKPAEQADWVVDWAKSKIGDTT